MSLLSRELCSVQTQHFFIEAREHDLSRGGMLLDELCTFAHGNLDGGVERVTIDAATDRGKRDRRDVMLERKLQAAAIATRKQLCFAAPAAIPHWTDGM